jgi:hypothetical protein
MHAKKNASEQKKFRLCFSKFSRSVPRQSGCSYRLGGLVLSDTQYFCLQEEPLVDGVFCLKLASGLMFGGFDLDRRMIATKFA